MGVSTAVVENRQTTIRTGIFFSVIAKQNRSVYQNFDGETILADECKCRVIWGKGGQGELSTVERVIDCPIDEHKTVALKNLGDSESRKKVA